MPRQFDEYDQFAEDDDDLGLDFDEEPRRPASRPSRPSRPSQPSSGLTAEQRAEVKEIVLEIVLKYLPKIASAPTRGDRERYYDDVEDEPQSRRQGMKEARERANQLLGEEDFKPVKKENNLAEILADDCGGNLDDILDLS